jgi:integrase
MGIYKKDGVYWSSFTVAGVRFRKSLDCYTMAEARVNDRDVQQKAEKGLIVANPTRLQRQAVSVAVDRWLEDRKLGIGRQDKKPLSEKTKKTEAERAVIVKRLLGHLQVRRLQAPAIDDYIAKRRGAGVQNGTVNRELDIIRGVLKKAERFELAASCRNLPVGESIGRAFSQEEKAALLAAASRIPERQVLRLALTIALNTSMRPVEIKALQWRDIDWLQRSISLRVSKTKAGLRTIPMNAEAYAAILELRERAKAKCGDTIEDEWYLFFSDYGEIDPRRPVRHWRRAWRSVLKDAGVKKARFYDSRHTVVTELLQDPSVSEETAKSIVGHVSRKMLERYSHQRMAPKRSALDAPTFGTQALRAMPQLEAEAETKSKN